MVSLRKIYKERLKTLVLSFLLLSFAGIILIILLHDDEDMAQYQSVLQENILNMEKIKLTYIINDNSYFNMISDRAKADVEDHSVGLETLNIKYTGSGVTIDAVADKGNYELERFIKAFGNVKGSMNDMRFDTGEKGTLEYDYKDGKGSIYEGVIVYQGPNNIKAEYAEFDVNTNFILFQDNVTVDYSVNEGMDFDEGKL